jgi:hypothetical protein
MPTYVDDLTNIAAYWPWRDDESVPEAEEEGGFELVEEEDPMVNDDAQQKQTASKKKATARKTKTQIRWTRVMNSQLASSERIERPYMKENTKIGREDEMKAWGHVQQGLLSLLGFASGVSVQACKKKFWELYKTFKIENARSETATGNLPEAYYGPYIRARHGPAHEGVRTEASIAGRRKGRRCGETCEGPARRSARSETSPCGVRGSGRGEGADGERPEKRARQSGSSTTHFQDMLICALKPAEESAEDKNEA